jgi:hypothetical protein
VGFPIVTVEKQNQTGFLYNELPIIPPKFDAVKIRITNGDKGGTKQSNEI